MLKINTKLINVLILGIISGMPLCLVTSTMQAWCTDFNMSLKSVAYLSLVSMPSAFRWLWAPLLDRFTFFKLPRRKAWMLFSQIIIISLLYYISLQSPVNDINRIFILSIIIAFFSTTQDMAIDAQRVEYLAKQDYGIGAACGSLGYRIGLFISGALTIIIATYSEWQLAYQITLFLLTVLCVWAFFIPEEKNMLSEKIHIFKFAWASFVSLLKRPHIYLMIIFIFTYKMTDVFTSPMSGIRVPYIVYGLGYSLQTLAYINKFFGTIALILGGIIAGLMIRKFSIYRLLAIFGSLQIISNLIFLYLAYDHVGANHVTITSLAAAIIWDDATSGLCSTTLVALMMRYVDQENTATQLAWLITVASMPRLISGPISTLIQPNFGWTGLYVFGVFFALMFMPLLYFLNKRLHDI